MTAILDGETAVGLSHLHDIVHALVTFPELSRITGVGEKSLHRALSAHGNPTTATLGRITSGIGKATGYAPRLFDAAAPDSLTAITRNGFPIRVSSPERAILELLHLITTNDAVDAAIDVMSGLSTLRPQVVQGLLESCRSVKAKRLFLWTAEAAGHDWFSRLDPERLDLGKGKRSIYRGGRFDAKYRITVPQQEGVPNV